LSYGYILPATECLVMNTLACTYLMNTFIPTIIKITSIDMITCRHASHSRHDP